MNRFIINSGVNPLNWSEIPALDPVEFHGKLPGYFPSPMKKISQSSDFLGNSNVLLKCETERLTLPAFKILGASWAVYQVIRKHLIDGNFTWDNISDLKELVTSYKPVHLVTATDGNHGRGVAKIANWLGFQATVFMPSGTVDARIEGIRSEGAEVIIVDGSYDEAVYRASQIKGDRAFLVQDTSWPGYEEIPSWIIDGYSTLCWEIEDYLQENLHENPDIITVPVGVGSLAAAVIKHFRRKKNKKHPYIIGVEPGSAACAFTSLEAGICKTIPDKPGETTIMAGLNCGTLASIAWPVIKSGMDACVVVDDEWAIKAMRLLAVEGTQTSESGAACMAALLAIDESRDLLPLKNKLNLNSETNILAFVTEGITDPVSYEKIVRR